MRSSFSVILDGCGQYFPLFYCVPMTVCEWWAKIQKADYSTTVEGRCPLIDLNHFQYQPAWKNLKVTSSWMLRTPITHTSGWNNRRTYVYVDLEFDIDQRGRWIWGFWSFFLGAAKVLIKKSNSDIQYYVDMADFFYFCTDITNFLFNLKSKRFLSRKYNSISVPMNLMLTSNILICR